MSSELRAAEAYAPRRPSRWRAWRTRPRKPPPTTTRRAIFDGVKRYLIVLAAAGAALVGIAFLLVLAGARPERAFPLVFYLGGVLIAGGGAFSAADVGGSDWYWSQDEKEQRVSMSVVLVAVGLPIVAVGVLIDSQT
jgi:hypothetical protein